jgi:hypothetical protein
MSITTDNWSERMKQLIAFVLIMESFVAIWIGSFVITGIILPQPSELLDNANHIQNCYSNECAPFGAVVVQAPYFGCACTGPGQIPGNERQEHG